MNRYKLVWPLMAVFSLCICLTACINVTGTVEGLIPIVTAILGIAGAVGESLLPAEASLIQKGIALASGGLSALLAELKSYDANKTGTGALADLQAAFNSAQSNLAELLAAAQVKNPLTAQKIGGVVQAAIATISTLEAYVLSKHPAPAPPATS